MEILPYRKLGCLLPRYLSCCAARFHLPLSMSRLLEPPPARSSASSPVEPGTFACRLAGEREGARPPCGPWSQAPLWGPWGWSSLWDAALPSLPCRHLTEEGGVVLLRKEVDVSGGNDAHQFAPHGARSGDRDTREAMLYLGLQNITHSMRRAQDHRVCDETLLKLL